MQRTEELLRQQRWKVAQETDESETRELAQSLQNELQRYTNAVYGKYPWLREFEVLTSGAGGIAGLATSAAGAARLVRGFKPRVTIKDKIKHSPNLTREITKRK